MQYLDLTFDTAERNLACDEALLDLCEDGSSGEILRFWEPKDYFVVLGYSNKIKAEVAITSCKALGVPILRRPSGGGTVLQGPGCLNYSLILKIASEPRLKNLTGTNEFVLNRNCAALSDRGQVLNSDLSPIGIQGTSDLTLGARKFSGNAQRRKKNALLFHGTFLLNFDFSKISQCLAIPARQPDYRQNRPHADFLTNIHLPGAAVKDALRKVWRAEKKFSEIPHKKIAQLVQEKYSRRNWNEKF